MVSEGLLVRLEAQRGKEVAVRQFLESALPAVRREASTTAWFAIRFGKSEFGIFDVFPDEAARDAHLAGPIATAIMAQRAELFAKAPQIEKVDVLADKLPWDLPSEPDTKGLLLTFRAKPGHEEQVVEFLLRAKSMVKDEPKTTAWFAIRLPDSHYGIFDVFPSNGGRLAHLTGRVPRELTKHAFSLLGGVPGMDMVDVVAEKLETPTRPKVVEH